MQVVGMTKPGPSANFSLNSTLNVANINKHYGHVIALSTVSFSIQPGEVLGVIGPNGSGKTTLFECLGGVCPANEGAMLLNRRPLTSSERSSALFYLPDAISPWPAQTVNWAINFMLRLFGGRFELRDDVIHTFDLQPLLDRCIGALSKGQRKRALLAIGILMPQPLLLADEPFDGLDLRQTRHLGLALRSYAGKGNRTMLLAIHQIADAARVCDRFVLLSKGAVCGEGTLEQLSTLAASRAGSAGVHGLEEAFLALT